jgi:hypothetical protein
MGIVAVLTLFAVFGAGTPVQEEPVIPPQEQSLGAIRGHVSVPDIGKPFDSVQAVLMPPEWALMWRGDAQRRLDAYSQTYKRAIAQDPGIFRDISRISYREATSYVLARMQGTLGERFREWVREVTPEGRFEYTGIPPGDYNVVVLARDGNRGMIWIENLSVTGSVPEILEVENRVQ